MVAGLEELLVIEKRSAVTAFDLRVQVNRDGRERGLWIFLEDQSEARDARYEAWLEGAVEIFCKMQGLSTKGTKKFGAWLSLDNATRGLLGGKVREGALLEWPAMVQVYEAIGKELRKAGKLPRRAPSRRKGARRGNR